VAREIKAVKIKRTKTNPDHFAFLANASGHPQGHETASRGDIQDASIYLWRREFNHRHVRGDDAVYRRPTIAAFTGIGGCEASCRVSPCARTNLSASAQNSAVLLCTVSS